VLHIPAYKEKYHAILDDFMNTHFAEAKLDQQISAAADFLRPLVTANGPAALERFEKVVGENRHWDEPNPLKPYVHARLESVQSQLDGHSSGQILHNDQPKSFPVRKIIGFAIAMLALLVLHFIGWIWGGVAGFRDSAKWGLLNLCFYPITPAIYGFRVQRALGIRAASWVLFCAMGGGGVDRGSDSHVQLIHHSLSLRPAATKTRRLELTQRTEAPSV
jgi:hypothetical protein